MEVEAHARYLRITPRKARLVAATVVGMPVKDALTVLDFTPKAAAHEVAKVVKSAAANATNNFNQDDDSLVVKRILVNDGPTLKRARPRARGMLFSVFKRTCHITAVVDTLEQPRRRRAAPPRAAVPAVESPARSRRKTAAAADTKEAESDVAAEPAATKEKPPKKARGKSQVPDVSPASEPVSDATKEVR